MRNAPFVIGGLVIVSSVVAACGGAPPPRAAAPEPTAVEAPAGEPDTEREAEPQPTAGKCGEALALEQPVADGQLGEGDRVVFIDNRSDAEIRARLVDLKLKPAVPGTLRVAPGATGEIRVPAGQYQLRYRSQKTCEVRRGRTLALTGRRAGVEIAVKGAFKGGSAGKMRTVAEDL